MNIQKICFFFLLPLFFKSHILSQEKINYHIFKNERQAIRKLKKIYPDNCLLKIETAKGNMLLILFNETPLHRDNFIKLINKKFYDSLLFHRVINNFMIQGGDPDSKTADNSKLLGDGDVGYTIPAEFNPKLFHRKGMLCAARESDDINPQKASSGCQFYIVQGKIHTDETLKKIEYRVNKEIIQKLTNDFLSKTENQNLKTKYNYYTENNLKDSLNSIKKQIDEFILPEFEKTNHYCYSDIQKQVYKTIGGTPHLDNNYTVFGEVVFGSNVIDAIAKAQTDSNDRPLENIRMKITIIKALKK
jgi:cyclophilin family peptidyl-prolyl cis-trans isomerase